MIETITLSPDIASIGIGGLVVIYATCRDIDNNIISPCPTLEWNTSDDSIATVELIGIDSCLVTGVYPGIVNITAKISNTVSNPSIVTVTGSVLESISIYPTNISIKKGERIYFNADCKDENNDTTNCPNLAWNSSDPTVGEIDSNGTFIGLEKGTTTVTASAHNIISNSANVNVSPVEFGIPLLIGISILIYLKIMKKDVS